MSEHESGPAHSAKGISYKSYVSKNSPWYGLAEFWSFEPRERREWNPKLIKTLFFGAASGLLYLLLFRYEGALRHFEQLTHDGEKIDFLIPIVIALVFSLVHGAFTGSFWEWLGVTPKQRLQTPLETREVHHGAA